MPEKPLFVSHDTFEKEALLLPQHSDITPWTWVRILAVFILRRRSLTAHVSYEKKE